MGDGLGYAPLLTPGGLVGAYSPERNPVKRQKVQHFLHVQNVTKIYIFFSTIT